MDIPRYCSPNSHEALRKLARKNRIAAGLRPLVQRWPRRIVQTVAADGSILERHYILHPTKGWRRA